MNNSSKIYLERIKLRKILKNLKYSEISNPEHRTDTNVKRNVTIGTSIVLGFLSEF